MQFVEKFESRNAALSASRLRRDGYLNYPWGTSVMVGWLLLGWAAGLPAQEDDAPVKTESNQEMVMKKANLDVQFPVRMEYLIAVPKDYDSQPKWPLVLFLHGAGERGNDLDLVKKHGPPKRIEQGHGFPFITVAPQCPADRWWEPLSLSALLDEIEANYQVDPDRIYVTGLSMGGFGTWSLVAHSPERFAAAAPICGGGDAFVVARRIDQRVPLWIFHGARDRVVPLSRSVDMYEALAERDADVKLTVYPDAGHDSWTETYNDPAFYEWLLSHRRTAVDQP